MSFGQAQQPEFADENTTTNGDLVIIISDDDVMENEETPVVRKRRGRPPGSKNKISKPDKLASSQSYPRMSTHLPTSDDEGIINMDGVMHQNYIPQPQNDSASNSLNKPEFSLQEVQDYGGWVPADKFERQACPDLRRAFRQGVRLLAQRNEILEPVTQSPVESALNSSHPGRWIGNWDLTKENELSAAWDNSLTKKAIENSPSGASEISAVWKLSFNVFGMDPLSLLSMYHDLEFDNSGNGNGGFLHQGEIRGNPLWTLHFCHKLKRIMTHPMFTSTNSHKFLPIAIRWTVMCRTNDHLGFSDQEQRILDHVQCGDLGRSTDLRSISERFREHQAQLKADGLFVTPQAELLLRIIDHTGPLDRFAPSGIALVKTRDLGVVIGALDSLNCHGMSMTCETHYQVYRASLKSRGYPSGLEELLDAYKKSWKNIQKRKITANAPTSQQHEFGSRIFGYGQGIVEGSDWNEEDIYSHRITAGNQRQEKHCQGSGEDQLKNNLHSSQGAESGLNGPQSGFVGKEMRIEESQLHQDSVHPDRLRQIFFPNHPQPTTRPVSENEEGQKWDFMGIESPEDEYNVPNREGFVIDHTRQESNISQAIGFYNFGGLDGPRVHSLQPTYHRATANTKLQPGGKRSRNKKQEKQQRKRRNRDGGGQGRVMPGARTTGNTQEGWNSQNQVYVPSRGPPTGPRSWRARQN
ncbi:hypothetical protein ACHAPU_006231 [Fusarium lateritium]